MAIAIDPTVPFSYVLLCDRELPAEEQTVWTLRGLSHKERTGVENDLARQESDGALSFRVGSQRTRILKAGILGFENLRFADGREVPFEKQGQEIHDRTLDVIPDAYLTELANAITEHGRLTEKDSD